MTGYTLIRSQMVKNKIDTISELLKTSSKEKWLLGQSNILENWLFIVGRVMEINFIYNLFIQNSIYAFAILKNNKHTQWNLNKIFYFISNMLHNPNTFLHRYLFESKAGKYVLWFIHNLGIYGKHTAEKKINKNINTYRPIWKSVIWQCL